MADHKAKVVAALVPEIIEAALVAAILFVLFRYIAAFSLVQTLVLWALALVVCWAVEELLYQPPQPVPFRLRIGPNWQALLLDFGPVEGQSALPARVQEAFRSRRPDRGELEIALDQHRIHEALWDGVRDRLRADQEELTERFYLLRDSITVTFLKPDLIYWDIYGSFSGDVKFEESTLDQTGFEKVYVKSFGAGACPRGEWFPMVIGLIGSLKWWEGLSAANSGLTETCPAVCETALSDGSHTRLPGVKTDQIVGAATVPIAIIPAEEFLPYWRIRHRGHSLRSIMREIRFEESIRLLTEEARARYGWEETLDFSGAGPVMSIKHKYFTVEHWSI